MSLPPILATGFEPFGEHAQNPSWDVLASLGQGPSDDLRAALNLRHPVLRRRLPVDYAQLAAILPRWLDELQPAAVLHFGVMGETGRLRLERLATRATRDTPDNAGFVPEERLLHPSGPDALTATLDNEGICGRLVAAGYAAGVSEDAGGYLCNAALYHSLSWAQNRARPVGFIHVPRLAAPFGEAGLRAAMAEVLRGVDEALG